VIAEKFQASWRIDAKTQRQAAVGAGIDACLTEDTLAGEHAHAMVCVIGNANIHGAGGDAFAKRVATLGIAAHFEQRATRSGQRKHACRAQVLAEGTIVAQDERQGHAKHIVQHHSAKEPDQGIDAIRQIPEAKPERRHETKTDEEMEIPQIAPDPAAPSITVTKRQQIEQCACPACPSAIDPPEDERTEQFGDGEVEQRSTGHTAEQFEEEPFDCHDGVLSENTRQRCSEHPYTDSGDQWTTTGYAFRWGQTQVEQHPWRDNRSQIPEKDQGRQRWLIAQALAPIPQSAAVAQPAAISRVRNVNVCIPGAPFVMCGKPVIA
jgi:hypothetical protein